MTKTWEARFDYNFKQTDKNEVGYIPAFRTEELKKFIQSEINKVKVDLLEKIEKEYGNLNDEIPFILINTADWIKIKKNLYTGLFLNHLVWEKTMNINKLKQIIKVPNPEKFVAEHKGNYCEYCDDSAFYNIISLADVLLAIRETYSFNDGYEIDLIFGKWNLKEDFDHQSEEFYKFLTNLLLK